MAEETKETAEKLAQGSVEAPEIDSKYRKIILAAQRSKQIQRGASPRTDMEVRFHKPTRIAMKELEAGLVMFAITKEKKKES